MKNELSKNYDQINEIAKSELTSAVGSNSPFEYIESLDASRKGVFRKLNVSHVKYNPLGHSLPEHFGVWPEEFALESDPMINAGKWVEEPQQGQHLVIKIQELANTYSGKERAALLRTNSLFSLQHETRPERLFGYGLGEKDNRIGYLLLEYIDPQFIQLDKYFPLRKRFSVEEVLALEVAHASFLDTIHGARLTHGDLEGPGAREHIFWNPKNHNLRVIDWNNAEIAGSVYPPDSGSYVLDHTGIGQTLMWGLTGNNFNLKTYEQLLTKYVSDPIRADIQKIIEMSIGLNAQSVKSSYQRGPRGTRRLYNDLLGIQRQFSEKGT